MQKQKGEQAAQHWHQPNCPHGPFFRSVIRLSGVLMGERPSLHSGSGLCLSFAKERTRLWKYPNQISTGLGLNPRPSNKAPTMKKSPALFLQIAIVLMGFGTLVLMLWEPHIEGRNTHATMFEIYFKDPFLVYVYVGSTPFFVALYQAFGLFGNVRQNGAFSQMTLDALRSIKRCAIAIIGFVAVGVVFIILFGDKADRPAGFFMSLLVTIASSVIAIGAEMFGRNLQNAMRRSAGRRG